MTDEQIYPLINECFGADKYHFGAMQYIRFARAILQAATRDTPSEMHICGECDRTFKGGEQSPDAIDAQRYRELRKRMVMTEPPLAQGHLSLTALDDALNKVIAATASKESK